MIRDLIIIGGGPAGNAAALAARNAGAERVTLVERDAMGGTCTNRGCIPTKLLLSRSRALAAAGGGSAAAGEWKGLQTYRRGLVGGLSRSIEKRCRERGVEVVAGEAALAGGMGVEVRTREGARLELEGRRILVAAGSAPAAPPKLVVDGRSVITSDHALSLDAVPASVIVVGSGAVGSEFATIFRRFGAAVTIVEAAPRLFPAEDPEVGELFRGRWEESGVRVVVGQPVTAVKAGGARRTVILASGEELEADTVLVAAGRQPLGAAVGCERAGVKLGERGQILVDESLATSASGIYAAGDVTGRRPLAHVATAEGEAVAAHALGIGRRRVPYPAIPWASFTDPELASVGVGQDEAARSGTAAVSGISRFMDNVKSRIDRSTAGFAKIVAEAESGRVIGGTIVGAHAADMIHSIAMAIQAGMTVGDLDEFVFLHPCLSETIADAVDDLKSKI